MANERAGTMSAAHVLRDRNILLAGLSCYLLGYGFHSYVHMAFMMSQTPVPTVVGGSLDWLIAVVVTIGVIRGHRFAPIAVALLTLLTLVGLVAVHVPPRWGPFSEPLRSNTMPMMWYSFAAALAGSLIAVCVGLRVAASNRQA
jgi:hypothetical protein